VLKKSQVLKILILSTIPVVFMIKRIVGLPKRIKNFFKSLFASLKTFILECKRVFTLTQKPSSQELKMIVKVTGLGMIAIGLIGLVVYLLQQALM
jgi:protein transport protein SEC61 subunit gamma-like protein